MINSISVIISIVLSVLAFLVSVGNLYMEKSYSSIIGN